MFTISSRLFSAVPLALTMLAGAAALIAAPDVVYTSTNAADRNEVRVYERGKDGALTFTQSVATGGKGTGAGLGSQGAVTLAGDFLLVVNAGSNDVTVFSEVNRRLVRQSRTPSGGTLPISATAYDGVVYVLNAGGTPNVSGFQMNEAGELHPIAGSTQTLTGANPAEVAFNRDGSLLAVTEKDSNTVEVFTVTGGVALRAYALASTGQTPFGFAFTKKNRFVTADAAGGAAGLSSMSSYSLGENGFISPITRARPTTQTSACWVAISRDGKYAFSANTGSGTISSMSIGEDGSLNQVIAIAGSTGAGSAPADMAFSKLDAYVYVLAGGTRAIAGFAVMPGGMLQPTSTIFGLPMGSAGLAAR